MSPRLLAAALICVLTLMGVGRGFVLASQTEMPATIDIGGIAIVVCHTGPGDRNAPNQPQHECCDTCVLMAPITLPSPPEFVAPLTLAYFVDHAHAMPWIPAIARVRTPRQSQAPPEA